MATSKGKDIPLEVEHRQTKARLGIRAMAKWFLSHGHGWTMDRGAHWSRGILAQIGAACGQGLQDNGEAMWEFLLPLIPSALSLSAIALLLRLQ
jgi:hypothetical protein